jgi:hypothetical protein
MSARVKHRIEFGFFGLALALSLLIWRGTRADGRPEEISLHCYGGNPSSEARSALESMNRDLHDAKDVMTIASQCVIIKDRFGRVREYHFSDSMLCLDGRPLVSGLNALHFEYRDQWGNLLTHRNDNCRFVRTIAYTVRLADYPAEVFVNSRTTVPHNQDHSNGSDQARVTFVQSH